MKRFTFIALHAAYWPVQQQCQLLGVSPSGYYAWCKRAPALVAEPVLPAWQLAALPGTTQRVFTTHAGRYGQRRLQAQLRREGHEVGRPRLRGWLRASGLRALCTRATSRPPRTTQADPPPRPPTKSGWAISLTWPWLRWAYLACWRDAVERRVVGLVSLGRHCARKRVAAHGLDPDRF